MAPPDPMPNSEVKRNRADGSVGSPHVRVGHFQTPNTRKALAQNARAFFVYALRETTYPRRHPAAKRALQLRNKLLALLSS